MSPPHNPERERRGGERERAWTELKWPSCCLVTAWVDGDLVCVWAGKHPLYTSAGQTERTITPFFQRIIYFRLQL